MSTDPLVSIITPAYNAEATITQTLKSVQSQTFRDWELLLVDDGSTDGTLQIIDCNKRDDIRIRCLRLDRNTGSPAQAKNAALPLVRGQFITFLDADDWWSPEKLDVQLEIMVGGRYDLCYSGGWYVHPGKRPNSAFVPRYGEGWLFDKLLAHYEINNQTVMMPRRALERLVEPRFNPSILIGEDYELFMRIASAGPAIGLRDRLVFYRVHQRSISKTRLDHSHEGIAEVIRWVSENPILQRRCQSSLRHANGRLRFYKAQAAMAGGRQIEALKLLLPATRTDWRYAVLALSTLFRPLWRMCLWIGRRF